MPKKSKKKSLSEKMKEKKASPDNPSGNIGAVYQPYRFVTKSIENFAKDGVILWIDGDGLLAFLLQSERLDWAHGGSFLHLTWLAENFLNVLVRAGCRIIICFVDCRVDSWRMIHGAEAAREALYLHFLHSCDKLSNLSLERHDCADKRWKTRLLKASPDFVLSCDEGPQDLQPVIEAQIALMTLVCLEKIPVACLQPGTVIGTASVSTIIMWTKKDVVQQVVINAISKLQPSGSSSIPKIAHADPVINALLRVRYKHSDGAILMFLRTLACIRYPAALQDRSVDLSHVTGVSTDVPRREESTYDYDGLYDGVEEDMLAVDVETDDEEYDVNGEPTPPPVSQIPPHDSFHCQANQCVCVSAKLVPYRHLLFDVLKEVPHYLRAGDCDCKIASDLFDGRLFYAAVATDGAALVLGDSAYIALCGYCQVFEIDAQFTVSDATRPSVNHESNLDSIHGNELVDAVISSGDETNITARNGHVSLSHFHTYKLILPAMWKMTEFSYSRINIHGVVRTKEKQRFFENRQRNLFARYMEYYSRSLSATSMTESRHRSTLDVLIDNVGKYLLPQDDGSFAIKPGLKSRKEQIIGSNVLKQAQHRRVVVEQRLHALKGDDMDQLEALYSECELFCSDLREPVATLLIGDYMKRLPNLCHRPESDVRALLFDKALKLHSYGSEEGIQLADSALRLIVDGDWRTPEDMTRFKLGRLNEHLNWREKLDPDPRVDGFVPDAWQREVMDCVDDNKSALVVVPTSAGKTFVSFYAVERVLRNKHDPIGRVVFVLPTRALVNQTAATVCKAFNNEYGVFTRKFRRNVDGCRVLVTVPACLHILLTHPFKYPDWGVKAHCAWVSTLRYVVFDEIHLLGGSARGDEDSSTSLILEQLLKLCPCPYLALSASIGSPERLEAWMRRIRGDDVCLIQDSTRFADLRKCVYVKGLRDMHPLNVFHGLTVRENAFMNIDLEPRDCLSLYDAMASVDKVPHELEPSVFLGDIVSRESVREYSTALKQEAFKWKELPSVIGKLSKGFDKELNVDSRASELFDLLNELVDRDELPVIIFCFNRNECELMAEYLLDRLMVKDRGLNRDRGEAIHLWNEYHDMYAKWVKSVRDGAERRGIEIDEMPGKPPEPGVPRPQYDPSCTFVKPGCRVDGEEMKHVEMKYANPMLLAAMDRGIGVHHRAMDTKYRQAVEILMRRRHIQVVIATGTLAYGIHTPCRTVVFLGDSFFLNPVMFHQMSGRAGRRGYDKLGRVVFLDVPYRKIVRLMVAPLPTIRMGLAVDTSTTFKMLELLHAKRHPSTGEAHPATLAAGKRVFSDSLCTYMDEDSDDTLLDMHFRFSLDLLLKIGAIDEIGCPQLSAVIISHMFYAEPANLAFCWLMRYTAFKQLCVEALPSPNKLLELAIVLAHIFARRRLSKSVFDRTPSIRYVHDEPFMSQSRVLLEPLSGPITNILEAYDSQVLHSCVDTMNDYAVDKDDTTKLPLSHIQYPCGDSVQVPCVHRPPPALSPFAALSSPDDFYSADDLALNSVFGRRTWQSPAINISQDSDRLNRYAVDFFIHGSKKDINLANEINSNDVFDLLEDFMMKLRVCASGLEEMSIGDTHIKPVFKAIDMVSKRFSALFRTAYGAR